MFILQAPDYRNPLNLKIGQVVFVELISDIIYNKENEKVLTHSGCPRKMTIVGTKKKALGHYIKGYKGFDLDSCEPPSFKVTKYLWFYECKLKIYSNSF